MIFHALFFRKLEKMSQNLSSAAVMIGALSVNILRDWWNKEKGSQLIDSQSWRKKNSKTIKSINP